MRMGSDRRRRGRKEGDWFEVGKRRQRARKERGRCKVNLVSINIHR